MHTLPRLVCIVHDWLARAPEVHVHKDLAKKRILDRCMKRRLLEAMSHAMTTAAADLPTPGEPVKMAACL